MPSIDIDRDAAHRAAQDELNKPIYSKGSAADQFLDWLNDLIYRMLQKTATVPGGWFTATVLLILLAVAVFVAVHVARRTMRARRGGDQLLFEAAQLTAAQHRATAESYAAEGDWAAAIRHRLRAVARQLEETGVLAAAPAARPTSSRATPAPRCPIWPANCPERQRLSTTSPTASSPEPGPPTR